MTEQQAKQIVEMRLKGVGYKSIGTVVGLSRDIVRNYCKNHNLTADMFPPTTERTKIAVDQVGRTAWQMTYFLSSRAMWRQFVNSHGISHFNVLKRSFLYGILYLLFSAVDFYLQLEKM